jgi:hypothetical protein
MTDQRPLRLLVQGGVFGTGLLLAALAGCGSVVASAPAAAPAASSGTAPAAPSGTTPPAPSGTAPAAPSGTAPAAPSGTAPAGQGARVGCASVDQATAVTIRRADHLIEPQPRHPLNDTYYQQAEVRALFGQMCAAVTHPASHGVWNCPADFGIADIGAFYDGSRPLALFTYDPGGCQQVSITAAGKTMATLLVGRAAAAAPHLAADLAAILGPQGANPGGINPGGVNPGGVNPGGSDKAA